MTSNYIGVDIGCAQIKIVQISTKNSNLLVTNYGKIDTPDNSIENGNIVDQKAMLAALKSLLNEFNLSSGEVILGISNQDIVVKQLKFPEMPRKELTEALEFELADIVNFSFSSMNEVAYSYDVNYQQEKEQEVVVVACQRDTIQPYISILRQVHLKPSVIDLNVFAISRVTTKYSKVCFMDIGTNFTTIYVQIGGLYKLYRVLPFGSNLITKGIMETFNVDQERAVEIKLNNDVDYLLTHGVKNRLRTLIQEYLASIYQTLEFLRAQVHLSSFNEVLEIMYLSGGTAQLKGLTDLLSEELGIKVEVLDPFMELSFKQDLDYPSDPAVYSAAVGLALRGSSDED